MKSLVLVLVGLGSLPASGQERRLIENVHRPERVRIGVLVEGRSTEALKRWNALAGYLSLQMPSESYTFEIVPLNDLQIASTAAAGDVDFLLTNPSSCVWLEAAHYAMRILTIKERESETDPETLCAVILTRADRSDIRHLSDLRGKTFAAVDRHSFEGWQVAWREFVEQKLDPSRDFSAMEFKGSPDLVLAAIEQGSVDAGTVGSDVYAAVDHSKLRVLDPKPSQPGYSLPSSTTRYPQWSLTALHNTSEKLSKLVTIALLKMSADDPYAKILRCGGWSVPRSYRPVRQLMRDLKLPPFETSARGLAFSSMPQYQDWLVVAFVLFLGLMVAAAWVVRLSSKYARLGRDLETGQAERKEAERARNDTEALYHSLVETLPQNIFRKGTDERFTFVNQRFCATLGRTAEDIIGKTDADFFPPELAAKYRADDLKVMETRAAYETVEQHVTPDGQTHYVQVIKSPLFDADENVTGTQCIFWDVTGKRRAEEELAKSEERFALAVRGSNDGLFDWNIAAGEIYYSPRFKELLGYPDHELPNTVDMHFDRIHPEDVERVKTKIKNHLKTRAPFDVEYRARTRSGEFLWFHARGQALWDSEGKAIRMAGSLSDITDRKMSEEQLREQNIKLQEMARSERKAHQELMQAQSRMVSTAKLAGLGEMVAGVAHEINNPLSFVSNNVCVLQRDLSEVTELIELYRANEVVIESIRPESLGPIRELWERVDMEYTLGNLPGLLSRTRDGLKRIQQIVKDLRVFARLDESDLNEVDINAGIESTVNIVLGHAKKKQLRIALELQPLPQVTCYPAKINQVVMNLVSNAIDASHEGGVVHVRSHPEGAGVVIEVQDHGTGIPSAVRERIFDPFFTTKPVGIGTGLGLSISYGIVADHGGVIEVESVEGEGTTFTIRLPCKPPHRPANPREEPALASK